MKYPKCSNHTIQDSIIDLRLKDISGIQNMMLLDLKLLVVVIVSGMLVFFHNSSLAIYQVEFLILFLRYKKKNG